MSKLKKIFAADPIYSDTGIAIVRIATGIFMVYHGYEIFDPTKMDEYAKWMIDLRFPGPESIAYVGKAVEFISGIFLTLGFCTRLAVIPLAITMTIICFGIGKGRIFMEDQHPFLFVLLAVLFFFTGPGKWSLDNFLFGRKNIDRIDQG